MDRPRTENKMGTMPVGKLLLNMALPMVISMLVQALYNMVDGIYVSRVSENALTAISLSFPIQNLLISLGSGVAVGMNSLLSQSLGRKEYETVNSSAGNSVLLSIICYIFTMLFGVFAVKPYFLWQTAISNTPQADIAEIVSGGTAYLSICTICSFGIFGEFLFERMLQSTGRTFFTMITQSLGAILNIILDPLFIFGGLGIPAMGVAGAAVATVIGQIIAFLLAFVFNLTKNKDITFSVKAFRPKAFVVKAILAVGLPSVLMIAIGSVMTMTMNQILIRFSSTAVAVFGSYFKLQSFVFMPLFGLNGALISIVAYNYGARLPERIKSTLKLCLIVSSIVTLAGTLLFQLAPDLLLAMYNPSPEFLEIGRSALRTISLTFVLAGVCVMCSGVFQAFGNGIYSTIVSLARQLIALLPTAYLLSLTGRLELIWFAFPIAEVISFLTTLFMMYRIYKRHYLPMCQPEETSAAP